MAKKKLSDLKQTDGKVYEVNSPVKRDKVGSLDELFGYHKSQYKTHNESEYAETLAAMNKADLQQECVKVGLMPHDNREIMKERLLKAFRRTTASITQRPPAPVTVKATKKALDICSVSANKLV